MVISRIIIIDSTALVITSGMSALVRDRLVANDWFPRTELQPLATFDAVGCFLYWTGFALVFGIISRMGRLDRTVAARLLEQELGHGRHVDEGPEGSLA